MQSNSLKVVDSPRHSVVVRITHWITALDFIALLVSGIAILLAHPRLYWGETGAVGTPSLIDLPLPFVLTGQSGWGRYLHFLSAWICVFTGAVYVLSGVYTRHFRRHLVPTKQSFTWNQVSKHLRLTRRTDDSETYNVLQRLAYFAVVFVLFPLMIWTGLAMSPAVTSVFPITVTVFGGQQSARTIHFFVTVFLVIFVLVHITMVFFAGFTSRVRAMTIGARSTRQEAS